MSLTAVTVLKSGGIFDPTWVARLNRQIKEHIRPDRIVCLTDMDVKSCETIPLTEGWPGWFSKISLFRPGLFWWKETILYLDLDSLIVKRTPIEPVSRIPLSMLSDFYTPAIPASGMMLWQGGEHTKIYEDFAKNPTFLKSWRHGDGSIIGKHCAVRIQQIWPGLVGSYKADKLQAGPKGFSIVCWHGPPKFPDLPKDNWARREWERPTESPRCCLSRS